MASAETNGSLQNSPMTNQTLDMVCTGNWLMEVEAGPAVERRSTMAGRVRRVIAYQDFTIFSLDGRESSIVNGGMNVRRL